MALPRTGKTGLLARLILHYPGPVVSTPTKADGFANAVSMNGTEDASFWSSKASSYVRGLTALPA